MRWPRAGGVRVYYKHGGLHRSSDQFRLGVSDGVSIASALVNLTVELLNDDVPHVSAATVRRHALNGSSTSVTFGAHNLLVLDEDSPDAELTFTLLTAPAFGLLKLVFVRLHSITLSRDFYYLLLYLCAVLYRLSQYSSSCSCSGLLMEARLYLELFCNIMFFERSAVNEHMAPRGGYVKCCNTGHLLEIGRAHV